MPLLGAVKRRDLVLLLSRVGFSGPFGSGPQQHMVRGNKRLTLPNPHAGVLEGGFLLRFLRQAGISREEWQQL